MAWYWIVGVLVVAGAILLLGIDILLFLLRRERYKKHADDLRFLMVKMPRQEGESEQKKDSIQSMKQNIEIMNQIYKNFYGIYSKNRLDRYFGQPYISCEMFVEKELIKFMISVPEDHLETFEKSISSFYPGAVIDPIEQPPLLDAGKHAEGGYFVTAKDNAYPIKTYENFEADPMDSILASFSRVEIDETLVLQVLVSPMGESRQKRIRKRVEQIKSGGGSSIGAIFSFLRSGNDDNESAADDGDHGYSSQQISDIEKKAEDEGFNVVIRGLAISPDPDRPSKMMKDLQRSLNQYNYIGLNSLVFLPDARKKFLKRFVGRYFTRPFFSFKKSLFRIQTQVLNIKELASIYHFPHSRFNKNPRIRRQKFKVVPAPEGLSKDGILLGDNLYGGVKRDVKLGFEDRFRHFYVIGQTGTGKSTILRTMINQDVANGHGLTVIDPHGDLAEACLEYFPKERVDDLIYWDAGNTELPFGFNFLQAKNERERDRVTNDAVDMFIKLYGPEIFGPRIQDYFRNGVMTLMEQPDGGSLVEIVRLFTDEAFQKEKVQNVQSPVVRARWEKTYAAMGEREKNEMIPFFQSKFGSFTTTPILRNIIGQKESSFSIADVMNSGKCLIMNLSKGKMGDINANLLGLMIVSQIRLAAFRRAEMPEKERVPHFLYIDEFQNFVTPAIESILSEARKYKLGLVLAHQYIKQLEEQGTSMKGGIDLKDAIFGNVGNMMAYRLGVEDAEVLEQQFDPQFSKTDLMNLDKFKAVIKLSVDMQPTPAFSLNVKRPREDPPLNTQEKMEVLKKISALKYGRKKDLVDKEIYYRVGA